jgi:hypothetical protein
VGLVLRAPRLASGGGSLLEVDYRVAPSAAAGPLALDLKTVTLNEGGLVLTPRPVPGPDPTDGLITVVSTMPAALALSGAPVGPTPGVGAMGPVPSSAPASSADELRAAKLRADELLGGDKLGTMIPRAAAGRPCDIGALVDWAGGVAMSNGAARGACTAALRPEVMGGATAWVRPFLLELATRAADDPNRDLRIALPAAAETLPAVEMLA